MLFILNISYFSDSCTPLGRYRDIDIVVLSYQICLSTVSCTGDTPVKVTAAVVYLDVLTLCVLLKAKLIYSLSRHTVQW